MILIHRLPGPMLLSLGLGLLACAFAAAHLVGPVSAVLSAPAPDGYDVERMVLVHSSLPRLAMALLCGGALAASGAILQQVLRNPLASPTTLGIDAGARLALALATLLTPSLLGIGRDLVALLGSTLSTLLVFALVRRRDFSPVSLVLAGLVVSLYCGALSAVLVLVESQYLVSLFIWGGGSLSQQSWDPAIQLTWRLVLLALPILLLVRPLQLLELDDEGARSLGLSVARLRFVAVALAVALAALVASAVGVIGFIGLVAPILARLSGARRFGSRLLWSTVMGALLLLLTDAAVQLLAGASAAFLPTGAVTAVFGSPLLLLLLPRLKVWTRPAASVPASRAPMLPSRLSIALLAGLFLLFLAVALLIGRGASGEWQILGLGQWEEILPWRAPRLAAACFAGAMLAVAGFILQRLTGNEMASPEVLGISAGAIFAIAMSLFVFENLGSVGESVIATGGGLIALTTILALGRRSGFAPERVLLAGIALNALLDAIIGVLSASGDPRAMILLGWMGGSMSGVTAADAVQAGLLAVLFVMAGCLAWRWLSILPLGGERAKALGVPLARSRFLLLLLAAALTAAATPIIGPLTFVGLMAPHIVQVLGVRRPLPGLAGAVLAGAGTMAVADWAARTVAFPSHLPTGLVAALVGAPFLMWLLSGRGLRT